MLSRSHIEEANRQLHQMHKRLTSLENTIQEQNQSLLDKDIKHENLQRLTETKNNEIEKLKRQNKELEYNIQLKNKEIEELRNSLESFSGIFQYLPGLKSLVETMDQVKLSAVPMIERVDGNGQEDPFSEKEINGVSVAAMAKRFATNSRSRHFSISEDDSDREVEQINGTSGELDKERQLDKKDKEFYL